MLNKSSSFGFLTVLVLMMTALMITHAAAAPVPLILHGSNDWMYVENVGSSKDVARVMGNSADLVNGAYEGGMMAYTYVAASSAFYGSEVAGAKMTWTVTRLGVNSVDPVNLYLDLHTWVTTDEFNLSLGSTYHGIYAEFSIWEELDLFGIPIWFPISDKIVRLDSTGDLRDTLPMGGVNGPFMFLGRFEVASGLSFAGPGVASADALGYVDFRLWADDPNLPVPTPEPATILLLCFGMIGLAGVGRRLSI